MLDIIIYIVYWSFWYTRHYFAYWFPFIVLWFWWHYGARLICLIPKCRLIFTRICQTFIRFLRRTPTCDSLHSEIIIAVDATPNVLAGYCVNLKRKTLEYYVLKMEDFPFHIEDKRNADEFEMRNLQLALAVWADAIQRYKAFRVYTDNNAVYKMESEVGSDAKAMVNHFTCCLGIRRENGNVHINGVRSWDHFFKFARYIKPVDDMTRGNADVGLRFLRKLYGIQEDKMTEAEIQKGSDYAKQFYCRHCTVILFKGMQSLDGNQARNRRRLWQ